jgi:hypothetical protein
MLEMYQWVGWIEAQERWPPGGLEKGNADGDGADGRCPFDLNWEVSVSTT